MLHMISHYFTIATVFSSCRSHLDNLCDSLGARVLVIMANKHNQVCFLVVYCDHRISDIYTWKSGYF